MMHRAADYFDLETVWHSELKASQICPGCGDKVPASMVRHMPREKCGYVFDWNGAIRAGLATKKEMDDANVMLAVEDPAEFEAEPDQPKPRKRKG